MSDLKPTPQTPWNDPKKPLENPAMKKAIENARANDTPENRNAVVNEMLRSTFLVPVHVSFDGQAPRPDKTGRVALPKNTKISFALLSTTDKKQYFMAFTDWDELHKWRKDPGQQTMMVRFDDYAMLLGRNDKVAGFVINPFGGNIRFERNNVELIKKQRDAMLQARKHVEEKRIKPGDKVVIVELSNYPDDLLGPVCDVLEKNAQVNEAYIQMMIVNDTDKSYLMVLDSPKDNELFKAVIQAAEPHLKQVKLDMRLTIAATPLGQQGIRGSEPFYSRVRGRVYLEDDEED